MVPPNSKRCFSGAKVSTLIVLLLSSAVFVRSESCTPAEQEALCIGDQVCARTGGAGSYEYKCCMGGDCTYPSCKNEEEILEVKCHVLAQCNKKNGAIFCSCPEGLFGTGFGDDGCEKESWIARTTLNLVNMDPASSAFDPVGGKLSYDYWRENRKDFANLFFAGNAPDHVATSMVHDAWEVSDGDSSYVQISVGILLGKDKPVAEAALVQFSSNINAQARSSFDHPLNSVAESQGSYALRTDIVSHGPKLYVYSAQTTGSPVSVAPVGFVVDDVFFQTSCLSTGCWVVDLIFTAGADNFVVFYIPKTGLSTGTEGGVFVDEMNSDYDYESPTPLAPWNEYNPPTSIDSTFTPSKFPCSTDGYNDEDVGTKYRVESCCITQFVDLYRPVSSFSSALQGTGCDSANCANLLDPDVCPKNPSVSESANAPKITNGSPNTNENLWGMPVYDRFGTFAGMDTSNIKASGVVDPNIGIYRARVQLDDKELRRFAGKLSGTVGVEYTIDTFIGMVDIKPTGNGILDSLATQTNLHFEKTDMFTVSTHGQNDYSYLNYVNLRLIEVLDEDSNFAEDVADNSDRTDRTSRVDPAQYVQLTFQLKDPFGPMWLGSSRATLIPRNSVRVGWGTAYTDAATTARMYHSCEEYNNPGEEGNKHFDATKTTTFASRLTQSCGPDADMCKDITTLDNSQFVTYNIPLGIDWLPAESETLENFVFVHLVVTADSKTAPVNDALQMKTTISAEIPVVEGGRYIFCDGVTAKTDLQDVVKATLIFGTARDELEYTRLRVMEDVGSSVLRPVDPEFFESSSIEAGMMTLVLQGDEGYFNTGQGTGSDTYGVQLEDVITVHIMEADPDFDGPGTVSKYVKDLVAQDGDDNYTPTPAELRTLGYELNGAFRFTIDRSQQTASLEPTRALLDKCQFNPQRPTLDQLFPTSCVLRKDVDAKEYKVRDGKFQTAMEVNAGSSENQQFIASFLGQSTYSNNLATQYSTLIDGKFNLNGRYNRAYWINPGYEWTPQQVGGQSIFTVSQKLFVFVLVTLDEKFSDGTRRSLGRRLLSSTSNDMTGNQGSAAVSNAELSFPTSPKTVLALANALVELSAADRQDPAKVQAKAAEWQARATAWKVTIQLTRGQACNQDREAVKKDLAKVVEAAFKASASNVKQVQVTIDVIDMQQENCYKVSRDGSSRRAGENDMSTAFATGEAEVLFSSDDVKINPKLLNTQPGIQKVVQAGPLPEGFEFDETFNPAGVKAPETSSSNNTPIIAGAAAGGAVLLGVVAVGGYMLMRRRQDAEPEFSTADTFKADLAALEEERGGSRVSQDLRDELRMQAQADAGGTASF